MTNGAAQAPAVFLDRDGTLIRDVGYLRRAGQIEILPGVPAALRLLRDQGFKLVVVTNQSAVARGWTTEREIAEIHRVIAAELEQDGARLDGFYYCPHHPDEGEGVYRQVCNCRKPKTGMIERACVDLALSPAASYVVGDQYRDIELAEQIGATGILIGPLPPPLALGSRKVAAVVDLSDAARWIIEHWRRAHQEKESA